MTNHRLDRSRKALGAIAVLLLALIWLAGEPAAGAPLALKRVMLSSGGVGYFEYEAEVEGDEELSLGIPLDQVDDVLKSIVIHDDLGGIGNVRLPSREPLAQIFRDFPFDPDALESPPDLLNALQGAEVRALGAREIEGRLFRVVPEAILLPNGLGSTVRHRVSLITPDGLQQFILEDAASVRFVEPELQAQIESALAAIAEHRERDRRVLRILTRGEGRRTLRVGYVVAVPVWKTSYRLTLASEGGVARLQGWAIMDNMSGRDWNDVELTLISGNPVTFRQALYAAYFVDRPEVPVEVLGRVLPRVDEGAIVSFEKRPEQLRQERLKVLHKTEEREMFEDEAAQAPLSSMAMSRDQLVGGEMFRGRRQAILPAAAEEVATQVVFRFPDRVSVRSGHSLMVPIANRDVPAERLARYQPETHARHPMASVRLTNDGETGLPPGVVTLYESTATGAAGYIGDAQLGVLPAGDERMVSFALDQKTRIDREVKHSQRIAKGKINRGIFELTLLDEQTTIYRVKAPAREDRLILIEHRRMPGWKLAVPDEKDVELTPSHYRIAHHAVPGSEREIEVTMQRPRLEMIRLIDVSSAQLALYAKTSELDEPLRQAFVRMGELRSEIDRHQRRLDELAQRRQRIFEEQKRIRENLTRIPRDSDLYRRYIVKLNGQEDELERILVAS
ncbi:MAG: DUF4139 domain-containing protein, partial [Alphaproteobacteria bacterium]